MTRNATHIALAFMLTTTTSPLVAQVTLGSSATAASTYVARGITFTSTPTLQPKIASTVVTPRGTLSAWAWGNVELANTPGSLSEGGGVKGVNEVDLVLQYAGTVGPLQVTAGAIKYLYSGHNRALTPASNTTEVYMGARFARAPLAPNIVASWDVETVHGVYVESAASQALPLGGVRPTIVATVGLTLGQEQRDVDDVYYSFAMRGLTHLDLGLTQTIAVSGVALTPAFHLQWAPSGQNTRAVNASADPVRATKLWLAVDVAWSERFRSSDGR